MMTSLNRPQRATMDQLKSPAIETMTSLKRPQAESHNQKRPNTENHYDFIEKTWEETYDLNESSEERLIHSKNSREVQWSKCERYYNVNKESSDKETLWFFNEKLRHWDRPFQWRKLWQRDMVQK